GVSLPVAALIACKDASLLDTFSAHEHQGVCGVQGAPIAPQPVCKPREGFPEWLARTFHSINTLHEVCPFLSKTQGSCGLSPGCSAIVEPTWPTWPTWTTLPPTWATGSTPTWVTEHVTRYSEFPPQPRSEGSPCSTFVYVFLF